MIMQGDYAGISETSLMLYLDGDRVRMDQIREINYQDHGWGPDNSPEKATFEKGKADVELVVEYLRREIGKAMQRG